MTLYSHQTQAWAAWRDRAALAAEAGNATPTPGERWRHQKTGGVYTVLQHATNEADRKDVVIYRDETDRVWVRPTVEFYDGRFVRIDQNKPA